MLIPVPHLLSATTVRCRIACDYAGILYQYSLGSLSQVTMIDPCTPAKPPAVLTGGVPMEDEQLMLKSTAGKWKIDVDSWDAENRDIRKL